MDAPGYLHEVQRRAGNLRIVRSTLRFVVWLFICGLLPALFFLYKNASVVELVSILVSASVVSFVAARRYYHAQSINEVSLALAIDAQLATRGRMVSFQELLKDSASVGNESARALIEDQLKKIEATVSPAEIAPYRLSRREILEILLSVMLVITAIVACIAFPPPTREYAEIIERLEEKIKDPDIPEDVRSALEKIAEQLKDDSGSQESLPELISAAEEKISEQQDALKSQTGSGESNSISNTPPPSAMATATPIVTAKNEPPADQKSGQKQGGNESSNDKPDSSDAPATQQDSNKDSQSDKDSGEQSGDQPQDSSAKGDKGDDKSANEKSGGEGDKDSSLQASADGGKEQSDNRNGEQKEGKGQPKDDKQSQNGESSEKGQALEETQQILDQLKDQQGAKPEEGQSEEGESTEGKNPAEQGKEGSDSQGEEKKEGDPQENGSQDQREKKPSQSQENKEGSDAPGEQGEPPRDGEKSNESPDSLSQQQEQPVAEKESQGDSKQPSSSPSQDTSKEENQNDSPAQKSSLPEKPGETKEYKEGDGKEWKGLDQPVGFEDKQIDYKNEELDWRYSGSQVGVDRGDARPQSLGTIVPRPLGRPDSINDSRTQHVPLEYRGIID